jgi:hypothetical protein
VNYLSVDSDGEGRCEPHHSRFTRTEHPDVILACEDYLATYGIKPDSVDETIDFHGDACESLRQTLMEFDCTL